MDGSGPTPDGALRRRRRPRTARLTTQYLWWYVAVACPLLLASITDSPLRWLPWATLVVFASMLVAAERLPRVRRIARRRLRTRQVVGVVVIATLVTAATAGALLYIAHGAPGAARASAERAATAMDECDTQRCRVAVARSLNDSGCGHGACVSAVSESGYTVRATSRRVGRTATYVIVRHS